MTHPKELSELIDKLHAAAQSFENGNATKEEVDAAMLAVEKFLPGYADARVSWPSQLGIHPDLISEEFDAFRKDQNALDAAAFLASPEGEKELENIEAGISALMPGVKTGLIPGSPEAEAIIAAGETAWYVKPGQEIHTVDPEARKRELAIEAEMDSPEFLAELNKEDEWERSTAVGDSLLPTELLAEFCLNTPPQHVNETAEEFAARLAAFEKGYFSEPRAARFVPGTPEFIAAEAQWLAEAQSESPEMKAAIAALNGETPEEYQARLDDANKLFISTRLHSAISSLTEARGRMSPEMYASPEIKEICNSLEVFTLDFDATLAGKPEESRNARTERRMNAISDGTKLSLEEFKEELKDQGDPSFEQICEAAKCIDEMRLSGKASAVEIARAKQDFLAPFRGQVSIIDVPGQHVIFVLNLNPPEPKPTPLDAIFADNASEQQN